MAAGRVTQAACHLLDARADVCRDRTGHDPSPALSRVFDACERGRRRGGAALRLVRPRDRDSQLGARHIGYPRARTIEVAVDEPSLGQAGFDEPCLFDLLSAGCGAGACAHQGRKHRDCSDRDRDPYPPTVQHLPNVMLRAQPDQITPQSRASDPVELVMQHSSIMLGQMCREPLVEHDPEQIDQRSNRR